MYIALDLFFAVPSMMLYATILSVDSGDVGYLWPISARDVIMDVALWQFWNSPPNSASVADAIIFIIMMHSTCTVTFSGGIVCISVLDFGPRKNIHLLCFVPLVMICSMHPNIGGESFQLFCILLLCLYVSHCNLKIEFFSLFRLLNLSVPPTVSLVPSVLWDLWI